jgi:hypothetical protein
MKELSNLNVSKQFFAKAELFLSCAYTQPERIEDIVLFNKTVKQVFEKIIDKQKKILSAMCDPDIELNPDDDYDELGEQRLVRRLADSKEKYILTKEELASISKKIDMDNVLRILKEEKIVGPKDDWTTIPFYKPKVNSDSDDGYHGRVGIHEVLKFSPAIKDLVMKDATSDAIEIQARKEGMMTMIEDGIFKAVQGLTSVEEILRVVSE